MTDWHKLEIPEAIQNLGSDSSRGLSSSEARRRLSLHGPNEIIEKAAKSPWLILWEQLTATMVLLLIAAALISALLGDIRDTIAILAIVILNAVLGFSQEYRAERAIEALKKLAVPLVKVRRDGEIAEISARELVPGDIVHMEAGNFIPADCRLIESVNLRTQEASLTGESEPVEKTTMPIMGENTPLGDRTNTAFMGTVVAYGRGVAVVTETGMATELGKIASMIQKAREEKTPLQRRMEQLSKGLAGIAIVLVGVVFLEGILSGDDVKLMFLTAMSLAVAAVPEGLPAVVTIALALGAQRMLARRALIRKLPAVETLGSVTVICSDKTGTLTENKMAVTMLDVAGHRVDLTEHLKGDEVLLKSSEERPSLLKEYPALSLLLAGGALCNDAILKGGPETFHTIGDPTEGAMVIAAAKAGIMKGDLEAAMPRISEIPFEAERKRMTTVHKVKANVEMFKEGEIVVFTKGAVDGLLGISSEVWNTDHAEALNEGWRERITGANNDLAKKGMRVLGVALSRSSALKTAEDLEKDLIFIGMVGMIDPPRPEVASAVGTCKLAGIRPIMITGDHPLTAQTIAGELGIGDGVNILTGADLGRMSIQELESVVGDVSVYARVSPEHKLNIVQALQNKGNIVAMTGDGVNDAPALKKADIGVAMGITGTDVAREASEMVLLDDNFATIVAAVEEGRVIYNNIRKFVKYLLASNSAEIWVMMFGPLIGMPLPLLPLQILWINLVTDGLPALALGVEPPEGDVMKRPPVRAGENFFARGMAVDIVWVGFLMAAMSLGAGFLYWTGNASTWQTMVFTVLTLSQMALAFAVRSERDSIFRIGLFSNLPLLGAVASTFLLQLAVIYVPLLQGIFRTKPLSAVDLMISLGLSAVIFAAFELKKMFFRRG